MGYYYGLAKFYEVAGNNDKKKSCMYTGWLIAVLLHGFYDFCTLSGRMELIIILLVFVVLLDVFVILKIQKASRADTPIYRMYHRPYYQVPFNQVYMNPYYIRTASYNHQTVLNGYNQFRQPQNPAVRYSQPEYLKYQYGEYSPYYNQNNNQSNHNQYSNNQYNNQYNNQNS